MAEETKKVATEGSVDYKAELEKAQQAYAELAAAFNKLLQEYNDLHVNFLFISTKK